MNATYSKINDISIVMKYLALKKNNTIKIRFNMGLGGEWICNHYRLNENLEVETAVAHESDNIKANEWEVVNLSTKDWFEIVEYLRANKPAVEKMYRRSVFAEIRTTVEKAEK